MQKAFVEAEDGDSEALKKLMESGADMVILENHDGKTINDPNTTVITFKK